MIGKGGFWVVMTDRGDVVGFAASEKELEEVVARYGPTGDKIVATYTLPSEFTYEDPSAARIYDEEGLEGLVEYLNFVYGTHPDRDSCLGKWAYVREE